MHTKSSPAPNLVASLKPQESRDSKEDGVILHAVIETPQGSRNKYKYEEELGLFKLHRVLPAGFGFPYSFGFVPQTLGEDGDPLDVLVIADEPVPVGCIVDARLIGVMEAEQTQDGKTERNDRLIAVAALSRNHSDLHSFKKMNPSLIQEMDHFFVHYHQEHGQQFRVLDRGGPSAAEKLLQKGIKLYRRKHRGNGNGKA